MGAPRKRKVTYSARHSLSKQEAIRKFQLANMTEAQITAWAVSDLIKVFMNVLHHMKSDPFGKTRLQRVYDKMKSLDSDLAADYGTFADMEEQLQLESKAPLDKAAAEKLVKHAERYTKITYNTQNYLSVLFMFSLLDLFGWKKKKIMDINHTCAEIAKRLENGKLQMREIELDLEAAGWKYPDGDKWEIATS